MHHLLVDVLRVAAIAGEREGSQLQRDVFGCLVDVLVIVEEDVEDALIGVVQQALQGQPPVVLEVLAFIHDNGIVLRPQDIQRLHQPFGQNLVEILRGIWTGGQPSLRHQFVSQAVEVGHVKVTGFLFVAPQKLSQGHVEAGQQDLEALVSQAPGFLVSQGRLARPGTAGDGRPSAAAQEVDHHKLLLG